MRGKLTITAVVMMLLFIGMGGCEDLDFEGCDFNPNYIAVVVQTQVCAKAEYLDEHWLTQYVTWPGALINIKIQKAGGENVIFEKTTGAGGCTEIVQGTFNVYKEQYVQVTATVIGGTVPVEIGGAPWNIDTHAYSSGRFATLMWEEISKDHKFGDTYYWNPTLDLAVVLNE